jgi:hypothetical protein
MLLVDKSGSLSVSNTKFDPKRYIELVVISIIKHDLSFSYVEYESVRDTYQYLRGDVPFISRNTIKANLVKMYLREKERIKSLLSICPGRICLTSNVWTSLTTDGYICLTTHFISKYCVLIKRVLNFSFMSSPHNGNALFDMILNLLQEWGIDKKIFTITLDNASTNDCYAELLKQKVNIKRALLCEGEFFHPRCCAHILNLIA